MLIGADGEQNATLDPVSGAPPGLGRPGDAPGYGPRPLFGGPVIRDVTSHSLGVATIGGFCEFLIARNAQVPSEHRRVFATSRDRQEIVRIRVCEGESRRLADNVLLGDLVLDGLPPRPRGETRIEVTFQIDAGGILNVTAHDPATGQAQRAWIQLRGVQSADEVELARERFGRLTGVGFPVPTVTDG
jgi:molecular chaperone DnaK